MLHTGRLRCVRPLSEAKLRNSRRFRLRRQPIASNFARHAADSAARRSPPGEPSLSRAARLLRARPEPHLRTAERREIALHPVRRIRPRNDRPGNRQALARAGTQRAGAAGTRRSSRNRARRRCTSRCCRRCRGAHPRPRARRRRARTPHRPAPCAGSAPARRAAARAIRRIDSARRARAAQVVVGHVVLQRTQHDVGHRVRHRDQLQRAVAGPCGVSAVQPWKVRNIEHTAGDGISSTSGRNAASNGS